ncbi:MAG: DUF2937 family protein [Pseudomonadota bacterium]
MGRLLAFLLGIGGAVLASQGPGFTLQYMQNLQGRIDELRPIVEEFETNVAQYGYTRDTAMAECSTATGLLDALCSTYRTTVNRYELLSVHMDELKAAGEWMQPIVLARTYYREIATSVYDQFEPAVPATIQGAAYAGGGYALLWGGSSFLFGILGSMFGGGRRYA